MEKVKDYLDGLFEGYFDDESLDIDVYTEDYENFGTLILYNDGRLDFVADDMRVFVASKELFTFILTRTYFATKELTICTRIDGTCMFNQKHCYEIFLDDFTYEEWEAIVADEKIDFYKEKFNLETADGVERYCLQYLNNCSLAVML